MGKPITRAEWDEWIADRRTQKLLTFIHEEKNQALGAIERLKAAFPDTDRDRYFENRGAVFALVRVNQAIENSTSAAEALGAAEGSCRG